MKLNVRGVAAGLIVSFVAAYPISIWSQETATVSADEPTLFIADWFASLEEVPIRYRTTGTTHMPVVAETIYRSGKRPVIVGKDNVVLYPDVIDTASIDPNATGLTFDYQRPDEKKQMFFVPFNAGWTPESLEDEGVMIAPPSVKLEGETVEMSVAEGLALPSSIHTPKITIEKDSTLLFSIGIEEKLYFPSYKEPAFERSVRRFPVTPMVFTVHINSGPDTKEVYRREYPTQGRKNLWDNAVVDLSEFTGETVEVEFRVADSGKWKRGELQPGSVLPLWGNPRIKVDTPPREDKPNIIMVSLDTLRADHLGTYGYERDTSPFLDKLADESFLFERCMANSSWTIPSHSSVFTGMPLFTHRTGGKLSFKLDHSFDTLAETFRKDGYATAAFTEGGAMKGGFGFNQGFGMYTDGSIPPVTSGSAPQTFALAQDWMTLNETNPFFCFVHTYEIHGPYTPPAPYRSKFTNEDRGQINFPHRKNTDPGYRQYVVDMYDSGIAYTDHAFENFWEELDQQGLLDNTYVIIFSDHGEEFWEHESVGHGESLFQEQLHVPLIIHFPKNRSATGRVPKLVSLSDIHATVLDLADIDSKAGPDSFSLLPLMTKEGSYPRTAVFSQLVTVYFGLYLSYQNDEWKYMASSYYLDEDSPVFSEDFNTEIGRKGKSETDFTSTEERNLVEHFSEIIPFVGNVPKDNSLGNPKTHQYLFKLTDDWGEQNPLGEDPNAVTGGLYDEFILMLKKIDERSEGMTPLVGQDKNLSESEQEALRALGYID